MPIWAVLELFKETELVKLNIYLFSSIMTSSWWKGQESDHCLVHDVSSDL